MMMQLRHPAPMAQRNDNALNKVFILG